MPILQGLLLFAFIPIVLFLFLGQPFGPGASSIAGLAIMVGHRFVAVPWMARHATTRCLWCARETGPGHPVTVSTGSRSWTLVACGPAHRARIGRFLTFVARCRAPIAIGIVVPLVILLSGSLAAAAGHPFLSHHWNAWQFKVIVAFTVAGTSIAYLAVTRPAESLSCPFPLHNIFLLGIRNTLWVFRVVGAWWLVSGALSLARALGGA
jgi:hypothetical protein